MSTPDEEPTWFDESPMRNWTHTDPTPTMWDWFDAAADGDTARRFRREVP